MLRLLASIMSVVVVLSLVILSEVVIEEVVLSEVVEDVAEDVSPE